MASRGGKSRTVHSCYHGTLRECWDNTHLGTADVSVGRIEQSHYGDLVVSWGERMCAGDIAATSGHTSLHAPIRSRP